MKITVKYTGRIGEQTDQTVRGILDNFGVVIVDYVVKAFGEEPGDHVLNCVVDDARQIACCDQLDQYDVDWHETRAKDEA